MKLSDCCGAAPYSNGDSDTEDYGICPDCKEHCEYIDDEETSTESHSDQMIDIMNKEPKQFPNP